MHNPTIAHMVTKAGNLRGDLNMGALREAHGLDGYWLGALCAVVLIVVSHTSALIEPLPF